MAKLEKMDPKQVPQVIILGVLTVGVLGWGAMQAMGSGGEKKPAAATAAATPDDDEKTEPAAAGTGTGSDVQITQAGAPAMQLPGTYNPDPFRPAKGAKSTLPPLEAAPPPPPVRKPLRTASALRWPGNFESVPSLGGGDVPAKPEVVVPAPPPAPIRPMMLVTGIIDVEDGDDMALIVLDGRDRRILQVGDVVANNYRVKKIAMDGVMLVNGTDKYFVSIGKKDESASAAPAPPAGVQPPQG